MPLRGLHEAAAGEGEGIVTPVRLQLSRRKGFYLQALSMATNGLPAVNCTRRGKYGNPFTIAFCQEWFDIDPDAARTKAVEMFRQWRAGELDSVWTAKAPPPIDELRGKNLACTCGLDKDCHADLLLELANQ